MKSSFRIYAIVIVLGVFWFANSVFNAQDESLHFTLLHVFDGAFAEFSPDGDHITLRSRGVYDIDSGARVFAFTSSIPIYSPDGRLLITWGEAIYDVETGEIVRSLMRGSNAIFSHDGSMIAISDDGVYDVATWTKQFAIIGQVPQFSPDGRWLGTAYGVYRVDDGDLTVIASATEDRFRRTVFSPNSRYVAFSETAVYDLLTGEVVHTFNTRHSAFSADSRYLATPRDGVIDLVHNERLFDTHGVESSRIAFNADSSMVLIPGDGVYEVDTGTRLIPLRIDTGQAGLFSPDGALVAIDNSGLYDVVTLERRFSFEGIATIFSHQGKTLGVAHDAIYDTITGEQLIKINDTPIAFSRDDRRLITQSRTNSMMEPFQTRIYGIVP